MKYFDWNNKKNEKLKIEREISFEFDCYCREKNIGHH